MCSFADVEDHTYCTPKSLHWERMFFFFLFLMFPSALLQQSSVVFCSLVVFTMGNAPQLS